MPLPFKTPVNVVAPEPPEATANVADKPAAVPVVFWLNVGQVNVPVLKSPLAGVPSAGVTNVGLVARTTLPDPVVDSSVEFPEPSKAKTVFAAPVRL